MFGRQGRQVVVEFDLEASQGGLEAQSHPQRLRDPLVVGGLEKRAGRRRVRREIESRFPRREIGLGRRAVQNVQRSGGLVPHLRVGVLEVGADVRQHVRVRLAPGRGPQGRGPHEIVVVDHQLAQAFARQRRLRQPEFRHGERGRPAAVLIVRVQILRHEIALLPACQADESRHRGRDRRRRARQRLRCALPTHLAERFDSAGRDESFLVFKESDEGRGRGEGPGVSRTGVQDAADRERGGGPD